MRNDAGPGVPSAPGRQRSLIVPLGGGSLFFVENAKNDRWWSEPRETVIVAKTIEGEVRFFLNIILIDNDCGILLSYHYAYSIGRAHGNKFIVFQERLDALNRMANTREHPGSSAWNSNVHLYIVGARTLSICRTRVPSARQGLGLNPALRVLAVTSANVA